MIEFIKNNNIMAISSVHSMMCFQFKRREKNKGTNDQQTTAIRNSFQL